MFEIVDSIGLLTWQPSDAEGIYRHIVVIPASVLFDSLTGTISLVPGPDGAEPTLEQDMLHPEQTPDPREEQRVRPLLEEAGDSIWDKANLDAALTSWVNAVSAEGQYHDEATPLRTRNSRAPIVQFAPALILRKRSDRSLLRFLGEAIEQIQEGGGSILGDSRSDRNIRSGHLRRYPLRKFVSRPCDPGRNLLSARSQR